MKETKIDPKEETDALQELVDDEDEETRRIINDIVDLREDNDHLPWDNLRDILIMPFDKLNELVEEHKQEQDRVLKEIREDKYTNIFDTNFDNEEAEHDHILQLYVSDISKYKNDPKSIEALKDSLFSKFEDATYRKAIESRMATVSFDVKHCPHFAEGKSIFER